MSVPQASRALYIVIFPSLLNKNIKARFLNNQTSCFKLINLSKLLKFLKIKDKIQGLHPRILFSSVEMEKIAKPLFVKVLVPRKYNRKRIFNLFQTKTWHLRLPEIDDPTQQLTWVGCIEVFPAYDGVPCSLRHNFQIQHPDIAWMDTIHTPYHTFLPHVQLSNHFFKNCHIIMEEVPTCLYVCT